MAHSSSSPTPEPLPDDIDRLFIHLPVQAPPAEFTQAVLARTVFAAPSQPQINRRAAALWGLVAVVCLTALGVSGYLVGLQLGSSDADGLLLLRIILDDFSLVLAAPGDVAAALGASVPWIFLVLSGFCVGVLTWTADRLASALSQSPRGKTEASSG